MTLAYKHFKGNLDQCPKSKNEWLLTRRLLLLLPKL